MAIAMAVIMTIGIIITLFFVLAAVFVLPVVFLLLSPLFSAAAFFLPSFIPRTLLRPPAAPDFPNIFPGTTPYSSF